MNRASRTASLALAAVSGFAALGYQIVWTRQLGTWLGHELVAALAVITAFFGGLALGAQLLGKRIDATSRPWRWYAGCEAAIAVWALGLAACLPSAAAWLAARIGAEPHALWHWSVAFLGPLALLLPACCAMGATLPAIERALDRGSRGATIGSLYAANTAGAVLGVLASSFALVPSVGLAQTARACAALNALCAVGALALARGHRSPVVGSTASGDARGLRALLAATGLLGIGYEVLAVRVLSPLTEDTVYTFALLLAVYLVGTAAGGALYQRRRAWRDAGSDPRARLLIATAAACLLGVVALELEVRLAPAWLGSGGVAAALAREAALAAGALLLPALAMGALFSHLCVEARRAGLGWGPALASNTLGAALAPLAFGVAALPALGAKLTLLGVVLGYLALASLASVRRSSDGRAAALVATCALALGALAPGLARVDVPEGGRVLEYREGIAAAVSVVEDARGVATLHIDNRAREGSSATLYADARQAWLPLLLHPRPHRALFLGLGSGVTASAATWDPALAVDAVELLPEVAEASRHFAGVAGSARAPRVIVADARRYVRAADVRYDVIVADLFHPARGGSGALYTVEHFDAVLQRLAPHGIFCQWLPLHQLDLETLRSIVSAFLASAPDATALLATHSLDTPVLGLLARRDGHGFAPAELRARRSSAASAAELRALGLEDDLAVLGSFVAGPQALRRFAAGAAPNSDDRPLVAHRAPLATHGAGSPARERLVELLRALEVEPRDVLPAEALGDASGAARLAAYWRARSRFIELGRSVRPDTPASALIEQLRAPLLAILRESPEFRPAYDPLLEMAAALGRRDAPSARQLLAELEAVQPAREEAGRLLRRLAPVASR